MSFTALQNGQAENRIVAARFALEHRGYFLARQGSLADPTWLALYNDGVTEEINPAAGVPRPDPDPAVRTANAVIPEAMRGTPVVKHVTGSLFTGQMRRFVQCQFSNGVDNQFVYQYVTTQGLFEWPPKIIGASAVQELHAADLRTYYIIEISAHGIFAAPVKMPATDLLCPDISDYLPTPAQRQVNPALSQLLSLGWAFSNRNAGGRVQQLADASVMGPVYALGFPWHGDVGWAFSYSGAVASNVLAKSSSDGVDTGVVPDFYETSLVDIRFSAASVTEKDAVIDLLTPTLAQVTAPNHELAEGDVAVISGCNESDYNGSHVAINVTLTTFQFALIANPALTSPATGSIKIAKGTDTFRLSATVVVSDTGTVTFQHGKSALWVPGESINQWEAVYPFRNEIAADGPVHVFYDGEEQIVTRWASTGSLTEPEMVENWAPTVTIVDYNHECACGGLLGTTCPIYNIDRRDSGTIFTEQHATNSFGFYGNGFNHVGINNSFGGFNRINEMIGSYTVDAPYGNRYGLAPECWFPDENGNPVKECASHFAATNTIGRFMGHIDRYSEKNTASSWLVIFPTEREAIMALSGTDNSFVSGVEYSLHPTLTIIHQFSAKDDSGPCPGATYDTDVSIGIVPEAGSDGPPPLNTSGRELSAQYLVRASGGFQLADVLSFDSDSRLASEHLSPFFTWTDSDQIAESPVLLMRGGLFYSDPTLTPSNQKGNMWYLIEGTSLDGGFQQLDGLVGVGFIGIV